MLHIWKEKETDEVNKMYAESNTFELQLKKKVLKNGTRNAQVSSMGKDVI